MTAVWPAELDGMRDLIGTYQETAEPNVASFKTEVGPPKLRRRTTAQSDVVQFDRLLTQAQKDILRDTFYRDTLGDGSLPFELEDAKSGVVRTFCFDPASPPVYKFMFSDCWRVSLSIRRMP